ncbi:outer membrane protein assembly factor BamE [Oceaniglobus roseus]|uniref:outer membrane protein assembly factor BamE n=1 Tax=Oceaniglobus roseus TaxID=1737570 RepID=UPI000C7F6E3A|nr:outer membrane protein assembly factor BamE [Kandeliimicrobium roseum]
MAQRRQILRLATGLVLGVALSGCAAVYRNHGYVPSDDQLAELTVGVDTRDTVAAAVGRPTSTGVLDASGWYYVQSRFRNFAYRAPEEVEREVLAISFDDGGVMTNIERFGLRDGRVVPLSRRVTESNIQGSGFLRQIFSNFGRVNAADFIN